MLGRLNGGNRGTVSIYKLAVDLAADGNGLGAIQSSDVGWAAVIADGDLGVADGFHRPLGGLPPEVLHARVLERLAQGSRCSGCAKRDYFVSFVDQQPGQHLPVLNAPLAITVCRERRQGDVLVRQIVVLAHRMDVQWSCGLRLPADDGELLMDVLHVPKGSGLDLAKSRCL